MTNFASRAMSHGRFVVHRHQARNLHDDFRLERDGVFKSWAIPKGMPTEDRVQRLALQTADHDLAFGDFEGTIPAGEYGAGAITVWDRGEYVEEQWSDYEITVSLHGAVVTGRYRLLRFARGGDRAWLLWRVPDEPAATSSEDAGILGG
jgi:bifunctional non-homologous end joining protein LigD